MSTPSPLEAAALDALRAVIDPLTGQDWVSTRHLKSLTVHNGQARVEIGLGYPAPGHAALYDAALHGRVVRILLQHPGQLWTLTEVAAVGIPAVAVDLVIVTVTIFGGVLLGRVL